jgi:hypothetical protein
MRNRIGAVSIGMVFGLTMLGAVSDASRVDHRFKGPGLILAYGGPLRHRVALSDMRENDVFMRSVRSASVAERIADTTAEHVDLVFFWGASWAALAKDSAGIERLPTSTVFDQSIQKGRLSARRSSRGRPRNIGSSSIGRARRCRIGPGTAWCPDAGHDANPIEIELSSRIRSIPPVVRPTLAARRSTPCFDP